MNRECVLGIDTSNYKTSVALVASDEIVYDSRKFLEVKQGERGLRQSEAFFQHVKNLPEMFEELNDSFQGDVCAVAYSSRPRPIDASYMPCFLAGESFAKSIASFLNVPAFAFSHQEGHIAAAAFGIEDKLGDDYIACHFSGGTCEVLHSFEIIGGTKDISFGQVLDRTGVAMGMSFPAGEEMDKIACSTKESTDFLTAIKVNDAYLNLSGFETQIQRNLGQGFLGQGDGSYVPFLGQGDGSYVPFIREIFDKSADAVIKMLIQASEKAGSDNILVTGGVASSRYLRNRIVSAFAESRMNIYFGESFLSSDNAVGVALLGNKKLWD